MAFMLRCPATSHRLAVGISTLALISEGKLKSKYSGEAGPFGPAVSVYWGFWEKQQVSNEKYGPRGC